MRFNWLVKYVAVGLAGLYLATAAPWAIAQPGVASTVPEQRREIVVGLPTLRTGPNGEVVVDPNVEVTACEACGTPAPAAASKRTARRPTMERMTPTLAARPVAVAQGGSPQTQLLPPGATPLPPTETLPPPVRGAPVGPPGAPPGATSFPPAIPPGAQSAPYNPQAMPPGIQVAPPVTQGMPPGTQYTYPGPQVQGFPQAGDPVLNQPAAEDWVSTNEPVPFTDGPCKECRARRTYLYWNKNPDCEPGIGTERVMLAPMALDITQPLNNLRMRFDGVAGQRNPDRLEYFWPRAGNLAGKGPPIPENKINYQEMRMLIEMGTNKASVLTEIPLRFVNPQFNDNVGGLGDVSVAPKVVLLDGTCWQVSQLFRTYFASGSPDKGLGTGHISIEPNFLFRYRWSSITYMHGQIKYWAPLGGDPIYSAPVLGYGFAVSHVLYESDTFALLPVLEFLGSDLQSGQQSVYPAFTQGVQHMGILNFQPGMRIVKDSGGDLGLGEIGISGGVPLTGNHWYGALIRVDMRWSW